MAASDHFVNKILKKLYVDYLSEMGRNAIKSDFRSSTMAAGGHFVKKIKVEYSSEMTRITYMPVKLLLKFVRGASWN